jgi:hypothetical protein
MEKRWTNDGGGENELKEEQAPDPSASAIPAEITTICSLPTNILPLLEHTVPEGCV